VRCQAQDSACAASSYALHWNSNITPLVCILPTVEQSAAQLEQFESLLTQPVLDAAWRYCYRLCRQREDAEDLLQDALAHGYNRLSQLKDTAAFKSWLMCIIRSQFLMNLRRRRVEDLVRGSDDEVAYHLPDHQADTEHSQDAVIIECALRQLPPDQREVLELFYLDGFSLVEVARILKLSQGAIQQRLFRARGALRRAVDRMKLLEPSQALASR
jgi:RNA polymerase sigma-70 factor, ECF subfamily